MEMEEGEREREREEREPVDLKDEDLAASQLPTLKPSQAVDTHSL